MVRRVFRYQFARQSLYSKFSFWTQISNTNAQSGATRKGNVCRDDGLYIYAYTNEALFFLAPQSLCVRTPRSNNSQYRQSFKATAIHSWRPVNNNEEVDLAIYTWADTLPKRRLLSPIAHGSWLVDNREGGEEIQNGKKERAELAMTYRISPERCAATHSRPCCTQIVIYFWNAICCGLEAHPQASSDDRLFISMMILQTSIDDFGIVECRPRPRYLT